MAEFYFDYKMQVVEDGLGIEESGLPKLYVERDYFSDTVHDIMYLTFPQWSVDVKKEDRRFDVATLSYDDWGVDPIIFEKNSDVPEDIRNKVEKQDEVIEYDEYVKRRRYVITNSAWKDLSGVGVLTLKKEGKEEQTTIYIAVNFVMKNRIRYQIIDGKIIFTAQKAKAKIKVRIYYKDRYPCLTDDKDSNEYKEITLDFSHDTKYTYELDETLEGKLHVTFDPDDLETQKHYLLECIENDTIQGEKRAFDRPKEGIFCPYCHGEMKIDDAFLAKYKKGGVACDGSRICEGDTPMLVRKSLRSKKLAKGVVYCACDLGVSPLDRADDKKVKTKKPKVGSVTAKPKKPKANEVFDRVFPESFLAKKNFKIVVVGSKRSGKTTFLSRLFWVTGKGESLDFHARLLKNATDKKNSSPLSVNAVSLKKLESTSDGIAVGDKLWHKDKETEFYGRYSMGLGRGNYPQPTDEHHGTDTSDIVIKYPFILDVNKKSYVYFYDIAGEDAEREGEMLTRLMETGTIGILYLVDGNTNEDGNASVRARINDYIEKKDPNIPIAVVLTKFDKLEGEFDENCHCLRGDSYDMLQKRYSASELENSVDIASEEIQSYLASKGLQTKFNFSEKHETNVKYFGVSAFSTPDAVYHEDQEDGKAEVNYLLHQCSTKRMELPIIWLLRQLGCIV
jgi:GTPase SAR1 family protein